MIVSDPHPPTLGGGSSIKTPSDVTMVNFVILEVILTKSQQ